MGYGNGWSDTELRRMVELLGMGKSYRDVGEALGRSLMSCKAKMNKCMRESDSLEMQETTK